MSQTDRETNQQALAWLVRTNDPGFDAWDDFTLWLEQDPSHASAYHRRADAAQRVMPLVEQSFQSGPTLVKAGSSSNSGRPHLSARRAGLALGAFGALAMMGILINRASPITYSTDKGEVRTVMLGGEDRLLLNGDTKLTVGGLSGRSISLESGEVLLLLRDANARQVEVNAGELRIIDIGTVFSVVRGDGRTRVAVAEGEVVVDPSGAGLHLRQGMRLEARDGQRLLRSIRVDPASVGAWHRGQLAYTQEPLSSVLADLRRSTGIDFRAGPSLESRTFTGTLSIDAVKADPRSLGPLLAVPVSANGAAWDVGEPRS